MYPYHNKILQRIRNSELTGWRRVSEYKFSDGVKPATLLYFSTHPYARPIRDTKVDDYKDLLKPELEII